MAAVWETYGVCSKWLYRTPGFPSAGPAALVTVDERAPSRG